MNILLLTHSYPHKSNTLKSIFIREQAELLSLYFNVTVVLFRVDYTQFRLISKYSFTRVITGNLTEYEVTIRKTLPGFTQLVYLGNTFRFIVHEILTNFKPDVIHSHLIYPAGFLGTILQRRQKIPNILTEHSKITVYTRSWFHKYCLKYTIRHSAAIISVSNSLKAEIEKVFPRPVIVIPNFVDIDKFRIKDPAAGEILNIGFIGGLGNYNKGLDLLLNAVSQIGTKNFILHIGGGGNLTEHFREMANELGIEANCKFYGELSRKEIVEFYSYLDLFVLPSRYETFGIVLIEAMACGIPVISTMCGGPQDIVTGETGILVGKDNAEALAKAIVKMAENLGSYDREKIRRYAEENFGRKAFIDKVTLVYDELLKKERILP